MEWIKASDDNITENNIKGNCYVGKDKIEPSERYGEIFITRVQNTGLL